MRLAAFLKSIFARFTVMPPKSKKKATATSAGGPPTTPPQSTSRGDPPTFAESVGVFLNISAPDDKFRAELRARDFETDDLDPMGFNCNRLTRYRDAFFIMLLSCETFVKWLQQYVEKVKQTDDHYSDTLTRLSSLLDVTGRPQSKMTSRQS